ncbi:UNVERIFIED_CONTAM: hypothetical protein PYX00_009222 [Menopon gallinae]|uniref:Uncharacterized protein n=1 Tax=Menopon gallinae TaxID=328185 RepID=A0AAW2HAP9_9NEOP
MWTLLLYGLLAVEIHRIAATEYKGNTYMVQEHPQEFSSPGAGDPANYAPWAEDDGPSYIFPGGNYMEVHHPYSTYPANEYPSHYVPHHTLSYSGPMEDSHVYQESMPSIHTYKPSFSGKDYNEYPHILPPGGKSIEQLQQEADLRMKKYYYESRENQKMVGEKIKKLRDTYGYGTIGYPGYKSSIKYEPIDLGTHNAIDLGTTLDGPGRLPLQTVTVTKTLGVRVPQPYPVRQEVPVPAPFPVPVTEPHFDESIHTSKEVKQYLDAFASEFAGKPIFTKPFSKEETKTAVSTTPKTYSGFRPSVGVYQKAQTSSPRTVYRF